jgi:hypothetical protein
LIFPVASEASTLRATQRVQILSYFRPKSPKSFPTEAVNEALRTGPALREDRKRFEHSPDKKAAAELSLKSMTKFRIPSDLQVWIDARKQHRLSHVVIQMARELGMNPKKLGGLNNHRQERWKAPLPEFIADLYLRRLGRSQPETVLSIEQIARNQWEKKKDRRARRAAERAAAPTPTEDEPPF